MASEEVFWKLMNRHWVRDEENAPYSHFVVRYLAQMVAQDEAAALKTLELPLLETFEPRDDSTVEFLQGLLDSDPDGFWQLIAHPNLNTNYDSSRDWTIPLLHLESRDAESAAVIEALPWVQDGVIGYEAESVMHLARLALISQQVFHTLLGKTMDWLPPNPDISLHGTILYLVVSISGVDEMAALRIIEMPFLEVMDHGDYEALFQLKNLAESDPASLQELLSNPALDGVADGDMGFTISLLTIRYKDPELGAAIESLAWLQDGIGRPAYDNIGFAHSDPVEREAALLSYMINRSTDSRKALLVLLRKPWVQGRLTLWENNVSYGLLEIASWNEAISLRILDMPFLDTIEEDDVWILDTITSMRWEKPDSVIELLSHPELDGGITDDHRFTIFRISLEVQDPDAERAIAALPWVQDGVAESEEEGWLTLRDLALGSSRVLDAVLSKPWTQDGLTSDEASVIFYLAHLSTKQSARRAESEAFEIVRMPFLESVDDIDVAALRSLFTLLWNGSGNRGHLQKVLSHATLVNGITDEEAIVVAALEIVDEDRPELLDTLLDPELASVMKRVISLPLGGDTTLAVVTVEEDASTPLNMLERVVIIQEEFMEVPFPTSFAAMLVADADEHGGGGSSSGIITVDPAFEGSLDPVAHEAGHIYWSHGSSWINEGGASLMEIITKNSLFGSAIGTSFTICTLANNINEFDQVVHDPTVTSDIYASGCPYSLGQGLFLDLYHELGRETFRQRFSSLYLKMEAREHDDVCTGLERGLCYVRAAFVDDAAPGAAAIAEKVINHWYYGNPLG